MFVKYIQNNMTNSLKTTGGRRNKQNQNQHQNQNGGACGNSSSVAAAYGGSVPMLNVQQGGSGLVSTPYNQGGNVNLIKGGASLLPQMGGNHNPHLKGGAGILPQMSQMGGSVPGILPTGTTTGGSVLNELAVPAVLLYANNTFGKKKRYTGKRTRRSGKGKGKKSRRYRRR
jgi:hypothetical protein